MSRKFAKTQRATIHRRASMGPRQKCLGNGLQTISIHSLQHRFNGAETKMSRKLCFFHIHPYSLVYASMGPRQKCLGNSDHTCYVYGSTLASMGPRQKCLGNWYRGQTIIKPHRASMGPRQKCLGNATAAARTAPSPPGFNGAETKMSRKSLQKYTIETIAARLQWGRDKNVSEMALPVCIFVGMLKRFNGAETKMSRKSLDARLPYVAPGGASMGPRQKCLGNVCVIPKRSCSWPGFNGAETKMSRKSCLSA